MDGITVDRFGNLYAPTADSSNFSGADVRVWNSAGQPVRTFVSPELAINASFAPGDILYMTTLSSLYRVPITFGHPGDYNGDGVITEADYTFWKTSFGTRRGIALHADGNGNGIVDAADYVVWRAAWSNGWQRRGTTLRRAVVGRRARASKRLVGGLVFLLFGHLPMAHDLRGGELSHQTADESRTFCPQRLE